MTSALHDFLNNIARHPLLTKNEEIVLGRSVQAMQALLQKKPEGPYTKEESGVIRRGKRAKQRMINGNLRLVVNVAKKYSKIAIHLDLMDLIQEGSIGLNRAVEKFDPERGYAMSTYAYWWIRQGITRALTQYERSIRLPIHAVECTAKLRSWLPEYQREHGHAPSMQECLDHLGLRDENTLRLYLGHMIGVGSLDARIANDAEKSTLIEMLASDQDTPWDYVDKLEAAEVEAERIRRKQQIKQLKLVFEKTIVIPA